ncbi:Coiled-coil domain-containing protein 73, partial [Ophiophagus hannah]
MFFTLRFTEKLIGMISPASFQGYNRLSAQGKNSSEALLSIQLLDFKTTFLEAVEELRMKRDSENLYEKQISRHVAEKQDLVWQKEAVQHEKEALKKQHAEAITTLKTQFQAKMIAMEEEKISKYTLQKKLSEMEHKLQLYNSSKEDYQKRLNEFEKCHAVIMNQFELIKVAHGKLEKNDIIQELRKVTSDVIKSKVTCQYKVEEDLSLKAKELELQILQQKNSVEVDLNGKITKEIARLKEEKQ